MSTLNTFVDFANTLLSTEMIKVGRPEYQGRTLEAVRQDIRSRAAETLAALGSYTGAKFTAPMAWSARNAICIKVGYGSKNEAIMFFDDAKTIDTMRANGLSPQERKKKAVAFFERLIAHIDAGGLDAAIREKMESWKARALLRAENAKAKTAPELRAAA